MRKLAPLFAALVLGACLLPLLGLAQEGPPREPRRFSEPKKIWYLKFTHERPRRIALGSEYRGNTDVYWYLLYTIENTDPEGRPYDEHDIFIDITAKSDKNHEYHDGYHQAVYQLLRRKLGLKPEEQLFHQGQLTTPDQPGPDKVSLPRELNQPVPVVLPTIGKGELRRCVAIFHRFNEEMDRLVISFGGLTNDVQSTRTDAHTREITERFYTIAYDRPGDEFFTGHDPITQAVEGWELRTRVVKTDLK